MAIGNAVSLTLKSVKPAFTKIAKLSNVVQFEREATFALSLIEKNADLQEAVRAHPESLKESMLQVASIGLSLNPANSHCYLIPNNKRVIPWVSYRGMAHLATRCGAVSWIQADVVYAKDRFVFIKGNEPKCEHEPFLTGPRGALIGAYCVARLPDGSTLIEFMSADDLEKARKASKAKNSPAWATWGDEMRKKAVMKRAYKLWPQSPALSEAIHVMNKEEGGFEIEGESSRVEDDGIKIDELQLAELNAAITSPKILELVCAAYGVDLVADINASDFDEVMARLKAMKKAQEESAAKKGG